MKSLFLLAVGILVVSYSQNSNTTFNDKLKPELVPSPNIKRVLGGYDNIVVDMLWIRLIQNFDFCENSDKPATYNPGSTVDESLAATLTSSRCNKGWVYHMVDTITEIDAKFKAAHKIGALNLSIAVDDREGARLIFDKATQRFPDDWTISYAAAYHYLFEMQNPERAADLLMQASRFGGPSWLPILAARLYSKSGKNTLGVSVLEEYLKTNPTEEARRRTEKRLKELKDK